MVSFGGGHERLIEHRSSDVRGSNKSFTALHFKPWLTEALQKNGYRFQAKVQEATLPTVLTGHDVIIQVNAITVFQTRRSVSLILEAAKSRGGRFSYFQVWNFLR